MSNTRAMVTMGNNLISVDITGFRRVRDSESVLKLADGTQLFAHPRDIMLYSNDSVSSMKMEEIMNPTYLPYTGEEVNTQGIDSALIIKGDKQAVVELKGITTKDESYTILTLADGSEIGIHPNEFKLFNSKSKVMQLYQDRFLSHNNQDTNTKKDEDIDDYVFGL